VARAESLAGKDAATEYKPKEKWNKKFDIEEYNAKLRNRFKAESETDGSLCNSDDYVAGSKQPSKKQRRQLALKQHHHQHKPEQHDEQEPQYKLKRKSGR